MGGPRFEESFLPRGHGPSSFGGTGAQFSPHFEDVQHDFSKLEINEKMKMDGVTQRSKSTRRVSFNTTKGAPRHYEYYSFSKGDNWRVADRIKMPAPQDELEKAVAKGRKSNSVLETLKKMSPDRRAQIDRLLDQKNLAEDSKDAQWHCVFIDSPSLKVREVGGKRVIEHKKMDVIIAQHILPGRTKPTSGERAKSFVGERSDIREPIKFKDKSKNKDRSSQGAKESKDGSDHREDPFDINRLFDEDGAPMGKHGPIPEYPPPQHQAFNHGMGQPFGPPQNQPAGTFQPNGPGDNQVFGDPFTQHGQGQNLPQGIQIISDPLPPQNGVNGIFHIDGNMHPHEQHPNSQHPHVDNSGAGGPYKKQSRPVIIQDPPKSRRHYTKRWMNDDSSPDSDDESLLLDEDEISSHTSYGDDHEKLVPRGSLVPHRRSSGQRRGPTYREHHRGSSYPVEQPRRLEPSRRNRRYHDDCFETIIARHPRRHSSRERREAIKYVQPKRLEYQSRSPPLSPISTSSYSHSPSRRYSGFLHPHEIERESERLAEEYIREKDLRDREEWVRRTEKRQDDRDFFERSGVLDRSGRRVTGQDRYWPSSR